VEEETGRRKWRGGSGEEEVYRRKLRGGSREEESGEGEE
jgi:hypothetical protein